MYCIFVVRGKCHWWQPVCRYTLLFCFIMSACFFLSASFDSILLSLVRPPFQVFVKKITNNDVLNYLSNLSYSYYI